MKTTTAAVLLLAVALQASYSRIESMGKTDNYMEDDMSVFINPANMLLHKSFIFGELGTLNADTQMTLDPYAISETPRNPWFGGVFTRDLSGGSRLALGLAFNREDKWLSLLNQVTDRFARDTIVRGAETVVMGIPQPVNKIDLMVGFRHASRFAVGAHLYTAMAQDDRWYGGVGDESEKFSKREAFLVKGIVGVNKHFTNNFFLESSFGSSIMDFTFYDTAHVVRAEPRRGFNLFNRTRLFIPLSERFSLVPVFNFEKVVQGAEITLDSVVDRDVMDTLVGKNLDDDYYDLSAGLGVNFWEAEKKTQFILGADLHFLSSHDEIEKKGLLGDYYGGSMTGTAYSVVNFGIERQIFWDWLLARAGGRKVIGFNERVENYGTDTSGEKTVASYDDKLWENPANNDTRSDLIGVGLGVFFLRKLQMDFTLSEMAPYRLLYIFSGESGNIFTRFSCSYYF